nr:pilus assembly protein PilP [Echinimonas agarilytica]
MLFGCGDDLAEVKSFVQQVQDSRRPRPEPLPEIPAFSHVPYVAKAVRSPFAEPDAQLIEVQVAERKDCLTPQAKRARHPLESYAIDDLTMRGTLGQENELYALIEAQVGKLYRVNVGDYLGLFHGRITHISPRQITLVELVPEGDGCWSERISNLELKTG